MSKLFILSAALFVIVGLWRYFDSVWQEAPKTANPFDVTWTILVAIAITTGALILGMFYIATPVAYRAISRVLGTDEPDEV